MIVLVFETNLMWSSRLVKSLRELGHEAVLRSEMPEEAAGATAAIVNLGDRSLPAETLVKKLHEMDVKVIAHAGHKEKDLHELGREAGADILATNSQLTFKLPDLLAQIEDSAQQ